MCRHYTRTEKIEANVDFFFFFGFYGRRRRPSKQSPSYNVYRLDISSAVMLLVKRLLCRAISAIYILNTHNSGTSCCCSVRLLISIVINDLTVIRRRYWSSPPLPVGSCLDGCRLRKRDERELITGEGQTMLPALNDDEHAMVSSVHVHCKTE